MALGRSTGDSIREPTLSLVFQGFVHPPKRCAKEWWSMQTSVHLGALLRIDSCVAMVGAWKVVRSGGHKSRE